MVHVSPRDSSFEETSLFVVVSEAPYSPISTYDDTTDKVDACWGAFIAHRKRDENMVTSLGDATLTESHKSTVKVLLEVSGVVSNSPLKIVVEAREG